MYYEAITHKSMRVAGPAEAVKKLEAGEVFSHTALLWTTPRGKEVALVADGGLDNPWFEVAVIDLDRNRQIESITLGWVKTTQERIKELESAQYSRYNMGPANLPLDGSNEDRLVVFTCGCCGQGFKSTIAQQRKHDQDEGYGYCKKCQA